jgi:hypothetical protein
MPPSRLFVRFCGYMIFVLLFRSHCIRRPKYVNYMMYIFSLYYLVYNMPISITCTIMTVCDLGTPIRCQTVPAERLNSILASVPGA